MIYFILIPLFFVLMIGDCVGRIKNKDKWVTICQPGTTVVVLFIALTGLWAEDHQTQYVIWIAVALLISAVADGLLVDRSDPKGFIKGMILFLFAISTYGITWARLGGIHKSDWKVTIIMLFIYLILMFVFNKYKYKDSRKPTTVEMIGITIYLFVFTMVIGRAILTFGTDYFNVWQSALITIGSISFFAGDCQLGIYHFIDVNFPMGQAPPFYFMGQFMIALSCILW
ncbi:MAG: hypothetical protein JXR88_14110 [Clostridia bacterium]|nr:hypothetical protein [Clostridia bacterium]